MKLEISVGEAIDKLSILELKIIKIRDETKKIEIRKELFELNQCQEYKSKYELYYYMLMYVNEKIWDLTDIIKSITIDHVEFASISNKIFEFNQKRFRIKNWFNLLTNSIIKEQKSYLSTCCNIIVENEDIFFSKLAEINYISHEYDIVTFDSPIISIIKDFLKIPTIIYDEEIKKEINNKIVINLDYFIIPNTESIMIFTPKPIKYLIGGKFGDFIQGLSVINEKFYETGKKGVLYISNYGDIFTNGLENTYNDVYSIIIKQPYISDFKIYNNELFDINLTIWRNDPNHYNENWYDIFNKAYNIEWGNRKWLNAPFDEEWKNKIVINTTNYRWVNNIDFKLLKYIYKDDLIFISSDINQYDFFKRETNIDINYYNVSNFLNLITIINSCKLFIGSPSAPLSIAHSLHKDRICGLIGENEDVFVKNLNKIFKNMHC